MTSQSLNDTLEQVVRSLNLAKALTDAGLTEDMWDRIVAEPQIASVGITFLQASIGEFARFGQYIPAVAHAVTETSVEKIFDQRTSNALARGGIATVGTLAEWTEDDVKDIQGIGPLAMGKIRHAMKDAGVSFAPPTKQY